MSDIRAVAYELSNSDGETIIIRSERHQVESYKHRYSTDLVNELVRKSEAQAQIAARDAEIVQLREENERLKHKLKPQFFCSDILEEDSMSTREELVEHARDYDDDLQPFSVFEMEGYAKTHTSHGFFDKDSKCHWFNTEQEALCAAKTLKGGAA